MTLREQKKAIAKRIHANHRLSPPTKKDLALSRRHLKDSVGYNLRHAKDHLKAAAIDQKILRERE